MLNKMNTDFFQAAPLPTDLSAEEEPLTAVAPASADDVDSEPGLDLSGVAAAIGQVKEDIDYRDD